nr:hypothetical protein [Sphingorhabdus sp.]
IYVSASDRALGFSRTIHGYPRLGRPFCYDRYEAAALAANGQLERCYAQSFQNDAFSAHGGLTIIDTSDVSAGRSGHSDYLRSAKACLDFTALLAGKWPPRTQAHLPHVFRIAPYAKGERPDHRAVCQRR